MDLHAKFEVHALLRFYFKNGKEDNSTPPLVCLTFIKTPSRKEV